MRSLLTKLDARFFSSNAGIEPVREWLKKLSKDDKKIIGEDIKTVQFGWPLGMPLVKSLNDGLWEVRSKLTMGKIARILFFMNEGCMILVHGFIKKTQKTPLSELTLAKKRMKQFLKEERL